MTVSKNLEPDKLVALLRRKGLRPRSYSGRGMYGRYCVSINLDQNEPVPDKLPGGYSWDSMGLGRVLYWPNVLAPEDLRD